MAKERSMRVKEQVVLVKEPMLLLLKEKHGDLHFLVSNEEQLFSFALSILEKRSKGYWYSEYPEPKPLDFDPLTVPQMAPSLRESAAKAASEYTRRLSERTESIKFLAQVRLVLSVRDGRLAWKLLQQRRDYEYEDVRLERFEKFYA